MKKYWFVFSLYWQEGLQQRASFFIDRFRSCVTLISFYYLWSALLKNRPSFAGYDYSQMITYVLGMDILRSLVFASRTYEIAGDINHGRLSAYLLKPVNFFVYTFFRDLSEKSINLVSAMMEVIGLTFLFHLKVHWPHDPFTWIWFLAAVGGAIWLNFLLNFMVGCWGFWTAESGGPRFLMELFVEFSAGAFFPLDILSKRLQAALQLLPSPYLVFFPLQIFLEKTTRAQLIDGLLIQLFWMAALSGIVYGVWTRGLSMYGAQGS